MKQIYVIKNWDDHYENNRSKEIKTPSWIPIPNKLSGDGYTMIMEHEQGAAIYGAWIALVCIAQRCDTRGTLVRSGGEPHDIASISRMTRINKEIIRLMIDFSVNTTKWLEIIEMRDSAQRCGEGAALPQEGVPIENRTESIAQKESKEQNDIKNNPPGGGSINDGDYSTDLLTLAKKFKP